MGWWRPESWGCILDVLGKNPHGLFVQVHHNFPGAQFKWNEPGVQSGALHILMWSWAGACHFRATEVRLYRCAASPHTLLSQLLVMFQTSNIAMRSQTSSQWSPLEEPPADFLLLGNVWLLLCLCEWHEVVWQVRVLIVITFIFFLAICTYCALRDSLNSVMWCGSSSQAVSLNCKVELLTLYMQLFYVTFKKTVFLLHKSFPIKPSHLYANSVLPKNTVVVTCRQTCNWWRTACL